MTFGAKFERAGIFVPRSIQGTGHDSGGDLSGEDAGASWPGDFLLGLLHKCSPRGVLEFDSGTKTLRPRLSTIVPLGRQWFLALVRAFSGNTCGEKDILWTRHQTL